MVQMRQIKPAEMFRVLKLLLNKIITKEITIKEKTAPEVESIIQEMNKKLQSKHYEGMFHCFRAKIEQKLNEGYTVQKNTKADRLRASQMREVYNAIEYAKEMQLYENRKYDPDGPPITIEALVQAYRDAHQSVSP